MARGQRVPADDPIIEAVRSFCDEIFQSGYRLEVANAIAARRGQPFCNRDLAAELGWADSRVGQETRHLYRAKLLVDTDPPANRTGKYMKAAKSVFWTMATKLYEERREVASSSGGRAG